ncbi:MAG: polyprenyl diphosphate synthase [Candidatus Woykebacteria bacterium]
MKKVVPRHVAIIMDGNRRWAEAKKVSAYKGHEAGLEALESAVKGAKKLGVKYLTVYALSTENIRERSKLEISFLFSLIKKGLAEKLPMLKENGVQVRFIGDLGGLPVDIQKTAKDVEKRLSKNNDLFLSIALNYGSRDEIVQAVRKINKPSRTVTSESIEKYLYTTGVPDPDLIIRTGGQRRLSNFLLWQSVYSELYFTDTLWPDFSEKELKKIAADFSNRVRNFGR